MHWYDILGLGGGLCLSFSYLIKVIWYRTGSCASGCGSCSNKCQPGVKSSRQPIILLKKIS